MVEGESGAEKGIVPTDAASVLVPAAIVWPVDSWGRRAAGDSDSEIESHDSTRRVHALSEPFLVGGRESALVPKMGRDSELDSGSHPNVPHALDAPVVLRVLALTGGCAQPWPVDLEVIPPPDAVTAMAAQRQMAPSRSYGADGRLRVRAPSVPLSSSHLERPWYRASTRLEVASS